MFKTIRFILIFLFIVPVSIAQFYESGQDPANLKWLQTDSEHFKIIFPSGFEKNINLLANKLEDSYLKNSNMVGYRSKKIPVIIHNQTVKSNAFVGLAPRRMELYTYPDPNFHGQEWFTELSLHEFRHVSQVDKVTKSSRNILSILTGEQGTGLISALLPFWFLEGDAVFAETVFTNSGRGRLPSFEMEIKSLLLNSEKNYSFSKSYLGSYRDFVPDYYRYGFQLVSYGRKKYGEDFWYKTIDYVSKYPFLIFPFHRYSKLKSGKGFDFFYEETMNYLKNHWETTLLNRNPEENPSINIRNSDLYRSYTQPKFINKNSVISIKSGLDIIPRFVQINPDGKEKKIFIPGKLNSEKISVHDSIIIWDEFEYNPRWTNSSYSVLKMYNMKTGRVNKLSSKTRFSSPEFSPGGDTIAVIDATTNYKFSIVLISSSNGKILNRIPSPQNTWLQDPAWIKNGDEIVVISVSDKGKKILSFNLNTNKWYEIYDAGYFNISELTSKGNYLYFNGSFDGIDNIYRIDLQDYQLQKVSNVSFGAFQPEVSQDNSTLIYSEYTKNGYDLRLKKDLKNSSKKFEIPLNNVEQPFFTVQNKKDESLKTKIEKDSLTYHFRLYSKFLHLFKFHSWSPFYFDYFNPEIDNPSVSPGITLLSQNYLGTSFTSLAYEYNDNTNYFHLDYIYKGLYPIFDISLNYGGLPYIAKTENTTSPELDTDLNYSVLSYIPLKFNTGKFLTGLQPALRLIYHSTYYYYPSINSYKSGLIIFEPGLYFYSYLRTSYRDIQPRFGITLNFRNLNTPFEDELLGMNTSIHSALYLPGFLRNHGIKVKTEWQYQKTKIHPYSNLVYYPRGYEKMQTAFSMKKYTFDYVMPLLYPDLNINPVLYLKRIRASIFTDYLIGKDVIDYTYNSSSQPETRLVPYKQFLSEGFELYADYHVFRFILEFTSGIRFAYLPYEKKINSQILFKININNF